jgi:hypothetical protein
MNIFLNVITFDTIAEASRILSPLQAAGVRTQKFVAILNKKKDSYSIEELDNPL